jgi:site-specific DNA-methyltransferase (adenine-specific)|tara:strand:- start:1334 stop:2038 length:705 start_codon:yes stop_codon:yes gene_type:complete
MLGDCLERMKEIEDGSVDMVMTDPPYGTTACKWDSVIPFEPMWEQLKRVTKKNGAIVLMASQPFTSALISSNFKMFKYCWVWDKGQGTGHLNAKKQPMKNCEDVVVFYKKQCLYSPQMRKGHTPYTTIQGKTKSKNYGKQTGAITVSNGSRYPLHLIEFIRDKSRIHPTQKPVALMEYLIKTYTSEGETVFDFTMGSGTTGVACVRTGRRFIGIEKEREYLEIAFKRIREEQKA